jgi:hypothetical protein
MVDDFSVAKVNIENPQVRGFIDKFFERMGIDKHTHPLGILWFALCKDETIYCVCGIAGRGDGSVEITDIYARPCKDGIRASDLVLAFFKALVDSKRIPYLIGVMLAKNKRGQRKFKKTFGNGPASHTFIYQGAK